MELLTLGPPLLRETDGPVRLPPKSLAVLVFLAVADPGGFQRRDTLVATFWPELDQEHARNSLNQALHQLRSTLGQEVVESRGQEELVLGKGIRVDAVVFASRLEEDEPEQALELYRGHFLEGFHVSGSPGFERWLDAVRARLQRLAKESAMELGRRAADEGRPDDAAKWLRRASEIAPTDERVATVLMEVLLASGDRVGAMRAYRSFAERLEDELGMGPPSRMVALVERIRNGEVRRERLTGSRSSGGHPRPDRPPAPSGESATVIAGDGTEDAATPYPPAADSPPLDVGPDDSAVETPLWKRLRPVSAGAALLGVVALGIAGGIRFGETGSPERPGSVARLLVADFADHTSDSLLGPTITHAVRIDLAQSRALSLAEPASVREALVRMKRDPHGPLHRSVAREVALREGWSGIVSGSVRPAGSGYVLTGEVFDPEDERLLAGVRTIAESEDELIDALDGLAKNLRMEIGESLDSVRAAPRLAEMTTYSLGALKRYTLAGELMVRGGRFETVKNLLEEAIALDSTFAMAYSDLSAHLFNAGDRAGGVAMMRNAYEHREGLPEKERWYLEGSYHGRITGDAEKAIAAFEQLVDAYPDLVARHPGIWNGLGNRYEVLGDVAAAASYFRRHIEGDSLDSWMPYWNLARAQVRLGELEEAERTIEAYERLFDPGVEDVYGATPDAARRLVAAARRDFDRALEISRHLLEEAREPALRSSTARSLASYAAATGRVAEAEAATRTAIASAEEAGNPPGVLRAALTMASVELWVLGDTAAGLKRMEKTLRAHPLVGLEPAEREYTWLAWIYAAARRTDVARRLLKEEEESADPYLWAKGRERRRSVVRAQIALTEGNPSEALDHLRPAVRDMGVGRGCRDDELTCPLYAVARAYEEAGAADSAAAVYERFLGTPSPRDGWSEPLGGWIAWQWADALERLAGLHERAGKPEKAAEAYGRLVELWKGCDAELRPRLERAERRARRLLARAGSP